MPESKMKEVAKILGVELGEEFNIKGSHATYKLTSGGMCFADNSSTAFAQLYRLLIGEIEIEKPILDKVEKRYLENVLRPFKDRVKYVKKKNTSNQQYLYIKLEGYECIELPYFEKNTMYEGMITSQAYTLKELGLFE